MADPMTIAQSRREEYKKDIAKKEAEIEELKELISDLDSFIEFGEALIGDGPADTKTEEKPSEAKTSDAKPNEAKPQVNHDEIPHPHAQSAPQPRVVKSRQPNGDWENDGDQGGIARVLAARNA